MRDDVGVIAGKVGIRDRSYVARVDDLIAADNNFLELQLRVARRIHGSADQDDEKNGEKDAQALLGLSALFLERADLRGLVYYFLER